MQRREREWCGRGLATEARSGAKQPTRALISGESTKSAAKPLRYATKRRRSAKRRPARSVSLQIRSVGPMRREGSAVPPYTCLCLAVRWPETEERVWGSPAPAVLSNNEAAIGAIRAAYHVSLCGPSSIPRRYAHPTQDFQATLIQSRALLSVTYLLHRLSHKPGLGAGP